MNKTDISPHRINVKRVTLPQGVDVQLSIRSAIWNIPEQDLVGAAVALLLADNGNLLTKWREHAKRLQQLRLKHHN